MAQLGYQFDPNSVEPAGDMSAMPAGEYVAMIIDSTIKPTKDGMGQYLSLTLQVIEGNFENRHLWHNLNLWSQNETASRISQQQLSAICAAIGYTGVVDDSEVLHNRPMCIKVAYVPANIQQGFKEKNEVKAFKRIEGATQQQTGYQQPAQPAQPAAPVNRPPVQQTMQQTMPAANPAMAQQPQQPPVSASRPAGAPAWTGQGAS